MSYSFGFFADTKEAAKAKAAEQFDAVVMPHQPVHARDRDAALANAAAMIDLLKAPDATEHVVVNMSGSCGWKYVEGVDQTTAPLTSVNANCSAHLGLRTS